MLAVLGQVASTSWHVCAVAVVSNPLKIVRTIGKAAFPSSWPMHPSDACCLEAWQW